MYTGYAYPRRHITGSTVSSMEQVSHVLFFRLDLHFRLDVTVTVTWDGFVVLLRVFDVFAVIFIFV